MSGVNRCEFKLHTSLNAAEAARVARILNPLLPPGKRDRFRAGDTVDLKIVPGLLECWDRLAEFGQFSRRKPRLSKVVAAMQRPEEGQAKKSKRRLQPSTARDHQTLVAELQGLVRPVQPIVCEPVPSGQVLKYYWLAKIQPYGSAYMIVPHVMRAGYSQERAMQVAQALQSGAVYPFVYCNRLRDLLEGELKPHIVAVRCTEFVIRAQPLPVA